MSSFKWEIFDATDDVVSGCQGGSVDLEDAKVTTPQPQWSVKPSDGAVALAPQPSGEVELAEKPRHLGSMISPTVLNFALVFLVVVVGFILVLDAWREHVTFEKFLYVLAPFIAGFTAGHFKRTA
jgi:hypothetical protein